MKTVGYNVEVDYLKEIEEKNTIIEDYKNKIIEKENLIEEYKNKIEEFKKEQEQLNIFKNIDLTEKEKQKFIKIGGFQWVKIQLRNVK